MTDQLALDLEPLNLEPIAPGLTIQERFDEFDRRNPWVYTHSSLTRDYLAAGNTAASGSGCCGAKLGWEYDTTTRRTLALNNSYRSRYVRKIVAEYPDLADAFETRTLRAA
jgi:hypothetical protein